MPKHAPRTSEFDTTDCRRILNELRDIVLELDERPIPDTNNQNRPEAAELSRSLLRARSLAELLGSELDQLYWLFRGYSDPRFPEV